MSDSSRNLVIGSYRYRVGDVIIDDDGQNLLLFIEGTGWRSVVIGAADRENALTCLQQAVDRRTDLAISGPMGTALVERGNPYASIEDESSIEDEIRELQKPYRSNIDALTLNKVIK